MGKKEEKSDHQRDGAVKKNKTTIAGFKHGRRPQAKE
jgi:hypothetical protein